MAFVPKAEICRQLYRSGVTVAEIAKRVDMEPKNVRKALKRTLKHGKGARPTGSTFHSGLFEPWKPSPLPSGTCTRWHVVDGAVQQCGKPATRQLCKSCKPLAGSTGNARWKGVTV